LQAECRRIFRIKSEADPAGRSLRLHRHQAEALQAAASGDDYVLTTGTGSGKSLSYIVPIVDRILRQGGGDGIKAIVIYPMNALANSQAGELGQQAEAEIQGLGLDDTEHFAALRRRVRRQLAESPTGQQIEELVDRLLSIGAVSSPVEGPL
jgi:superfamily II DNA helicase RecQ